MAILICLGLLYPTGWAAQPSEEISWNFLSWAEKPSADMTWRLFLTNMKGLRVTFCWRQVVTNYMFAYKQFVPRKSLQFSCTLFIRFWAWEDISSKIFSLGLLKGSLPRDFRLPVFSWISVPRAPNYFIWAVLKFFSNSQRYSEWKFITGANNTWDKLFTGVNDSGDKREKCWGINFSYFFYKLSRVSILLDHLVLPFHLAFVCHLLLHVPTSSLALDSHLFMLLSASSSCSC